MVMCDEIVQIAQDRAHTAQGAQNKVTSLATVLIIFQDGSAGD